MNTLEVDNNSGDQDTKEVYIILGYSMTRLFSWLRESSSRLLDPRREERIRAASAHLRRLLVEQRAQFNLDLALNNLDLFQDDCPLAIEHAYRSFLARAWKDGAISDGERKSLHWLTQALRLDRNRAGTLERAAGLDVFQSSLGKLVADGKLDAAELTKLRQLAAHLGTDVKGLTQAYFRDQADGLLRSLFASATSDGRIDQKEWMAVVSAAEGFGISKSELLELIRTPAETLIEQTLADARADGCISPRERSELTWLAENVASEGYFKAYVEEQIARVDLLEAVNRGNLPSVQSKRLGLRAGEIVHAEFQVMFTRTRNLKRGPVADSHMGDVLITDSRLIFTSDTMPFTINHRKVIDIELARGGFDLNASGKGQGTYATGADYELVVAIYRAAVRKVNQTLVASSETLGSRHIPRDVRQRVWQRYAGRCADCAATAYLEFDHIIPVARGGSNTDANVQLLCRGCNLKKSDAI